MHCVHYSAPIDARERERELTLPPKFLDPHFFAAPSPVAGCRFAIFVGAFCSSLLKRRIIIIKNQHTTPDRRRCRCRSSCCRPFSHWVWVLAEQPPQSSGFSVFRPHLLSIWVSGSGFGFWVLGSGFWILGSAFSAARSVAARLGH